MTIGAAKLKTIINNPSLVTKIVTDELGVKIVRLNNLITPMFSLDVATSAEIRECAAEIAQSVAELTFILAYAADEDVGEIDGKIDTALIDIEWALHYADRLDAETGD